MRFELITQVGHNANSSVYKARDLQTKAIVAVKQLPEGLELPGREVFLAWQVTHKNVCRVHDLHNENGRILISMEYLEGESLRDRLRRAKTLPLDECLQIAHQMMDGLEEAHRHNIIHRDLKPENVLIQPDGTVKLMDFGIARLAARPRGPTRTSNLEGTPIYVAPEAVFYLQFDARTDIYALGIILYELISGETPSREDPMKFSPSVPEHIQSAILRCTAHNPDDRFACIAEVRAGLTQTAPGVGGHRPPLQLRPFLLLCLLLTIAAAILLINSGLPVTKQGTTKQLAPAAPDSPRLPAVAVLMQGPAGDAIRAHFIRGRKFRVVERSPVEQVVSELRMSNTQSFSPVAAERMGHLVGAQYLLLGSSLTFDGQIQISARLVRVETGEVVFAENRVGRHNDVVSMAETIAAHCEEKEPWNR
jgi:TolB-like protein